MEELHLADIEVKGQNLSFYLSAKHQKSSFYGLDNVAILAKDCECLV